MNPSTARIVGNGLPGNAGTRMIALTIPRRFDLVELSWDSDELHWVLTTPHTRETFPAMSDPEALEEFANTLRHLDFEPEAPGDPDNAMAEAAAADALDDARLLREVRDNF